MFCHECGNKIAEGAVFCNKCGKKLLDNAAAPQITDVPIATVAPVAAEKSIHKESVASPKTNGNDEVLKTLIGKNSEYYLKHFAKIDRGEKSVNWLAFFFAPIILLYRKQYSYFSKMILPVFVLGLIAGVPSEYAVATSNLKLMTVIGYIEKIIGIYSMIVGLLCGIGFNKQYKSNLQKVIAKNNFTPNNINDPANIDRVKKLKPSALIPVAFLILWLIFGAVGVTVVESLTDNVASNTQNVKEITTTANTPSKNNNSAASSTQNVKELSQNEAKELLQKWLKDHPLPAGTYLDGEGFTHELDGKEYYAILLRGMPSNITSRAVDIFIDTKTRELFQSSSLEPLDKWYQRITAQIAQQENQSDVTYKGQPVSRFLGRSQNEIVNVFGQPGKSSPASITYADGTEFKFSNGNCIGIWSSNLSAFNIKGTPLQKNRDELISILGTPAFDGRENNLYRLKYHLTNGATLRFAMQNPGNKAEYIAVVKD